MMPARPAPADLFSDRDAFGLPPLSGPEPDEVLIGLAKLAGGPPLWGDQQEWTELVTAARSFVTRWYCPAAAAGWSHITCNYSGSAPSRRARGCRAWAPPFSRACRAARWSRLVPRRSGSWGGQRRGTDIQGRALGRGVGVGISTSALERCDRIKLGIGRVTPNAKGSAAFAQSRSCRIGGRCIP
jgi:hypothetical protein